MIRIPFIAFAVCTLQFFCSALAIYAQPLRQHVVPHNFLEKELMQRTNIHQGYWIRGKDGELFFISNLRNKGYMAHHMDIKLSSRHPFLAGIWKSVMYCTICPVEAQQGGNISYSDNRYGFYIIRLVRKAHGVYDVEMLKDSDLFDNEDKSPLPHIYRGTGMRIKRIASYTLSGRRATIKLTIEKRGNMMVTATQYYEEGKLMGLGAVTYVRSNNQGE